VSRQVRKLVITDFKGKARVITLTGQMP